MEGEAIFCYEGGWACSNDAAYIVERDIVTKEDGKMYSMHTPTVRLMDYFVTGKKMEVGQEVKVAFRNSEDGSRLAYMAKVSGLTDAMAVLVVADEIAVKNITDTIKKQNYG